MADISGTRFADVLAGTSDDDLISGLDGNDWIQGFAGSDDLRGDGGFDFVSYLDSFRGVFIDLIAGAAWDGVYLDRLSSFEAAIGSNLNDTIYGNSADNVIDGGGGADYLNGGAGADTVRFLTSERGVTIDITAGQAAWDGQNLSTLVGFENVIGSSFDDLIYGNSGANVIQGGRGFDRMIGGEGQDRFVFTSMSDNQSVNGAVGTDRVVDFRSTGGITTYAAPNLPDDQRYRYGDIIDLSALLRNETDYNGQDLSSYVHRDQYDAGVDILIDRDGAGTSYTWQSIVFLDDVPPFRNTGISSFIGYVRIDDGYNLVLI